MMKRLKVMIALIALVAVLAPLQAQVGKSVGLLDANRATQPELMSVPHMNADYVKAIMDKRPFANVTEFAAALTPPLNRDQLKEVYGKVFVHANLNTATDDEILSIPAAQSNRVLREFKEYRPYKSLAVFHREMRKYWDEAEVSRLEQYVFVPVNLNTATDEEILSIPAAQPNRVLREFKEYRPYTSLDQFHKEMRKYWDEKEVNRLKRYVTLN
jgi:DNA uptake protein ComE-like DNA-binding protein